MKNVVMTVPEAPVRPMPEAASWFPPRADGGAGKPVKWKSDAEKLKAARRQTWSGKKTAAVDSAPAGLRVAVSKARKPVVHRYKCPSCHELICSTVGARREKTCAGHANGCSRTFSVES